MKEEKFRVINFIQVFIVYVDTYFVNFPKKDIEIKTRIRNLSYDILEDAYKANISESANRIERLDSIIARIKVMDFLLNLCYDKQIINLKRYVKFGEKLDDIVKYTIGWKKSIKSQKENHDN